MASMTAKAYLTKVNEICKAEGADVGGCYRTGKEKKCPLRDLGCGTPVSKNKINTVIDIVKNYKVPKTAKCPGCGRDNTTPPNNQEIKFCPYCGTELNERGGINGKDD